MVIIPFPLTNLWVELHFLRNSSLGVQLISQRFPYSKCGSSIFTTPSRVYSSHHTLIIALSSLPSKGHFTPTQRVQKMISVESEKWWWWWWCVQNINTSYWDQNSWISKSDMILVNGERGQKNVIFAHTDTRTLTKVLCWY